MTDSELLKQYGSFAELWQEIPKSSEVNYEKGAYLDLFEDCLFESADEKVGTLRYYVYDPVKHGMPENGTYPVIFCLHGAGHSLPGKIGINWSSMEHFASPEYQEKMGGAYIVVPFANEKSVGDKTEGTWMTPVPGEDFPGYTEEEIRNIAALGGSKEERFIRLCGHNSIYTDTLFALLKTVRAGFTSAGDTFLFGTSAGGYSAWRMLITAPETFRACMLMSAAYRPSEKEVRQTIASGVPVWFYHGLHDEIVPFDLIVAPNLKLYEAAENFSLFLPEIVRHANGKAASNISGSGIEMGQHCTNDIVGEDLMFDDGTPMDPKHPAGVTGWIRSFGER